MILSSSGKFLTVIAGVGVEFFYFDGTAPIKALTGIVGTTGYINAIAWDTSDHLYALNGESGKLHVYTVTTTSEAPESPYSPPFCGTDSAYAACIQTLIVTPAAFPG